MGLMVVSELVLCRRVGAAASCCFLEREALLKERERGCETGKRELQRAEEGMGELFPRGREVWLFYVGFLVSLLSIFFCVFFFSLTVSALFLLHSVSVFFLSFFAGFFSSSVVHGGLL